MGLALCGHSETHDDSAGPSSTHYAEDHPLPVYNCISHATMQLQTIRTRTRRSCKLNQCNNTPAYTLADGEDDSDSD